MPVTAGSLSARIAPVARHPTSFFRMAALLQCSRSRPAPQFGARSPKPVVQSSAWMLARRGRAYDNAIRNGGRANSTHIKTVNSGWGAPTVK